MKTIHTIILSLLAIAAVALNAQDYPEEYLGLPGDNLNLYAVMNLFQQSETLEGFERSLNDEESMINNLDLNGDNLIDYITVSDYVEGNLHTIVLRATLGRNEQQDVAVFVVEKLPNETVQIQLIGDEALYGPNYIVEPIYAETPNPGYTGKIYRRNVNVVTTTYYDIAAWPLIRFIYHPRYVVWRSSWYWGYYPSYWRPWRAHYWHYYYGYHYHWNNYYYAHYRHWNRYRCRRYHTFYHNHVRVYSPTVVVNINKGRYRSTYSRPDRQRAGEELYTRSARRSGTVHTRQSAQRTASPASRTRSNVSTNRGSRTAVRTTSAPRSTVQRSQASRSRSTVQRSQPSKSRSTVQRSSSNHKRSAPAIQRSTGSSRSSAVHRSQPSKSRSSVHRSQPSKSRSSVHRSSSSHKRSAPAVKRSTGSSRSSAVHRSQPSKSRSTVHRSSSSRKASGSQRRSSSSRR